MLLVQKRGRGRTRGGFGLDTIHNGEQGTASREASDMSECVLGGGALWFDSTKGLEEGRMVLAQALPTCTVARFYHLSAPPYSFNFGFLELRGCRLWLSLEVPRASRPMGLQMEVN